MWSDESASNQLKHLALAGSPGPLEIIIRAEHNTLQLLFSTLSSGASSLTKEARADTGVFLLTERLNTPSCEKQTKWYMQLLLGSSSFLNSLCDTNTACTCWESVQQSSTGLGWLDAWSWEEHSFYSNLKQNWRDLWSALQESICSTVQYLNTRGIFPAILVLTDLH